MNPPAALHSAMSRDRKPFTYTPGGLDLSEIKSSRMAARLMRNAMNEGVPEVPKQSIQSPPMPSTPVAVPNFNCLPVQVFPSFNLPANPKSLLRTRSNPAPARDLSIQKAPPQPSQFVNNSMTSGAPQYDTFNKNTPTYSQINNNRPMSMFEYGSPAHTYTPASYGNGTYAPVLPEISYDAEYFQTPSRNNANNPGILRNETMNSENKIDNTFVSNVTNPFLNPSKYSEYSGDIFKPKVEETKPDLSIIDTAQFDRYSEKIYRPEIDSTEVLLPYIESNKHKENVEDIYGYNVENKVTNEKSQENINSESKLNIKNDDFVQITENTKSQNNFIESYINPETETKENTIGNDFNPVVDYSTFAPETKVSKPDENIKGADNEKKSKLLKNK